MSKRNPDHSTGRSGTDDSEDEAVEADVSRRDFLKIAALAGGAAVMGNVHATGASAAAARDAASSQLDLTIAGYPVDHVRALADGKVQVKGCNATFQPGKIGDLNTHVFSGTRGHGDWSGALHAGLRQRGLS